MARECYLRSDQFVERHIARDTILVPIAENVADLECLFTFNEVAGRIWTLLDGRTPIDQIVDQISAEYRITKEQALADTVSFIDSLRNANLIKLAEERIDSEDNRLR